MNRYFAYKNKSISGYSGYIPGKWCYSGYIPGKWFCQKYGSSLLQRYCVFEDYISLYGYRKMPNSCVINIFGSDTWEGTQEIPNLYAQNL